MVYKSPETKKIIEKQDSLDEIDIEEIMKDEEP